MSLPRPQVLVLNFMAPHHQALLEPHFDVIYAPTDALRTAHIAADAATIRAVLTIGSVGLTATEMDALPALELVCALGVGFENIDIAHARARGLALANGAGTNDDCVADHAFALLLAVVRNVPRLDAQCRQGLWRDVLPLPASVSHRRLGIVGLGGIGHKVAQRALGFGMQIGYHGRKPQPEVAHTYFADLVALAAWADFLVVATPGGPATRHPPPGRSRGAGRAGRGRVFGECVARQRGGYRRVGRSPARRPYRRCGPGRVRERTPAAQRTAGSGHRGAYAPRGRLVAPGH